MGFISGKQVSRAGLECGQKYGLILGREFNWARPWTGIGQDIQVLAQLFQPGDAFRKLNSKVSVRLFPGQLTGDELAMSTSGKLKEQSSLALLIVCCSENDVCIQKDELHALSPSLSRIIFRVWASRRSSSSQRATCSSA